MLEALQLDLSLDWLDLPGMADGAGYQRKEQPDTVELTLPLPPVVPSEPAPAPVTASGYRLPLRMPAAWVVQSQRTLGEDDADSATTDAEYAEPAADPATSPPTPEDATRAIQAQRQQTARHAWARLQVPLRQALDPRADTPWCLPIDWRAATERVARGRHLWPLPRRTQVRWPGGCVVLLDTLAPSLQPLRSEIDSIATRLRRSIGGRGAVSVLELEPASSAAEPATIRTLQAHDWLRDPDQLHLLDLDEPDAQPLPWHRWNGRTVVVISDLGAHERDTARRALWAARMRQALQNGVQLRALVPCVAPGLAHLPKALPWAPWPALQRGRRVAAVSPESPRLQTLLALLGFCGDASEPLLRGLVRLVSPGAEEAGWLWRLWNHDDVQRLKGGNCRLVDENGRAKPHLAHIRSLPVELLHAAFWLRRLLRAGLSVEDEHAAVLRAAELAPQLRNHDPELRLLRTAARRYLLHNLPQQLRDATGAERQRRGACAVVWVEKVAPVVDFAPHYLSALKYVRSLAHEDALRQGVQVASDARLGKVQLPINATRPDKLHYWSLIQRGRELVLCDQQANNPNVLLASMGPALRSAGVQVQLNALNHWLQLDVDELVVARWNGAPLTVQLQLGQQEVTLTTAQFPVLEIHLLWHPGDDPKARPLAEQIAGHFQGGAFASLLAGAVDVLLHCCGWSDAQDAPRPIVWPDAVVAADQPRPAQRVAVVPLVGREFNRALLARGDSAAWRELVAELGRRAGTDAVRVLPIYLDSTGMSTDWPVSLRQTQSVGSLRPDTSITPEERDARRLLDLVQSLAQWLSGESGRLQVFISHTKQLGSADTALLNTVRWVLGEECGKYLFEEQYPQPGSLWEDWLRKPMSAMMLVLRTDRYASSEWCQQEVLTAKQHGIPIVMLDTSTQGLGLGSSLFDNVPWLRMQQFNGVWDKNSVRHALALLLDVYLRRVLWQCRSRLIGDDENSYIDYRWLQQAPEPSGLVNENEVLIQLAKRYGDSDLINILRTRGISMSNRRDVVETLLPGYDGLRERRIGLSASDSEDLARLGLRTEHLRQAVRELARIVFVSGGTLAYGGNIDRDKFSRLLIDELRRCAGRDCGRMELWLSWQEHRRRSCAELDEVRDAMGVHGDLHAIGEDGQRLADPCADRDEAAYPPIEDQALKARGLTHLRQHLTDGGYARLLIGGKRTGYSGDMPGLLEEALMSLRQRQPVYLAGGFGGITLLIAAQIDPDICCPLLPPGMTPDAATDAALAEVRALVGTQGWQALRNGLSDAQNRQLAVTHRPVDIATLVTLGLSQLPVVW